MANSLVLEIGATHCNRYVLHDLFAMITNLGKSSTHDQANSIACSATIDSPLMCAAIGPTLPSDFSAV